LNKLNVINVYLLFRRDMVHGYINNLMKINEILKFILNKIMLGIV